MTIPDSSNISTKLETLNYCIEDGNLKIVNKDFTEILKKEKKKYIEEFQVSVNPKKDTVFVKKGDEQIYLEIIKKLLNINISMLMFKKYMKNGNIPKQKTLPSFNPEKLSDYYQRSEIIDFPEPLDIDKINSSESISETQKRISNSFSEDFSFSDASNDFSYNTEISSIPYKKTKSFGLNICMTPNESSEKMALNRSFLSSPPQISLATCYDDNSSSSSANSNSIALENSSTTSTTLYLNQPQALNKNLERFSSVNISPAPLPISQHPINYMQQMQIQIQHQHYHQQFKNSASMPLITRPERTKLNIEFNNKKGDQKQASSSYKIVGDEAKIIQIRSSLIDLLHLSPKTEIQKIIFVS